MAAALVVSGCTFDPSGPSGAGGDDDLMLADAAVDGDGTPAPDAVMADACVPLAAAEICNGLDDDCDGMVDEDFGVGDPCDGADTDMCQEGVIVCQGGAAVCDDATDSTVEICNTLDDDCDGTIDDGFNLPMDPTNCGSCGHGCVNDNGGVMCMAGMCKPMCSPGSADCDQDPDNGCELRDVNPVCMAAGDIGSIDGDQSGAPVVLSGFEEAFFTITVHEAVDFGPALTARVDLQSPPGVDYDLFVRCANCDGAEQKSEKGPGMLDSVATGHDDTFGASDYDLMIEVRYLSGAMCGDWTLTVTGNSGGNQRNCN